MGLSVGDGTKNGGAEAGGAETGRAETWGATIRSNGAGLNAGGFFFFALERIKKDPRPMVTTSNPMPRSFLPGELESDGIMSVPRDPAVNDLVVKTSFGETARRTHLV